MTAGIFFFYGKKSWSYFYLGWHLPEMTVMLQLFQHYVGISVKIRKTQNGRFLKFRWIFRKKFFRFPKGVSGSVLNWESDHFGMSGGIFFVYGKKSWSFFFLGWNLPEITVMFQLFHHYVGISVKIRKSKNGRFPILRPNLRPVSGIERLFFLKILLTRIVFWGEIYRELPCR